MGGFLQQNEAFQNGGCKVFCQVLGTFEFRALPPRKSQPQDASPGLGFGKDCLK
jgi:hypothetical protein